MSLKHLADELAAKGRYGDTELVHMTKGEVAGLQGLAEAAGGSLTINPETGKPEAFFLAALLPTILGGVGASMGLGALGTAALGAGVGALTNKRNPLMGAIMGGFGGFGGGKMATALGAAGSAAGPLQQAAMQNVAGQTASTMASGVDPSLVNALRPQMVADATTAAANQFAAQPLMSQAGQGITALGTQAGRSAALQSLGGASGALKAGSMAAAPMLYESMMPRPMGMGGMGEDDAVLPRYDYTAGLTGDYYGMGGDGSTRERQFFTQPTFTRRAAAGGIMSLAEGGETDPKDVAQGMTGASAEAMRYLMGQTSSSRPANQTPIAQVPVKAPVSAPASVPSSRQFMFDMGTNSVVRNPNYVDPQIERDRLASLAFSMPGNPYMAAEGGAVPDNGIAALARGGMKAGGFVIPADVVSMVGEGNTDAGYEQIKRMLPGATPIKGKDGGQADTVKTSIEGKQPARIAHGEMYVPPATVKRAGGAKKLYAMMKNVRKMAKGDDKQIKPVDLRKAMA